MASSYGIDHPVEHVVGRLLPAGFGEDRMDELKETLAELADLVDPRSRFTT